ncbi:MAG: hypothetical protein KF893_20285 [Caldilineaceae bacterium]|nr:hypothetical protein [Caldilineaceae bacterium]
MEFIPAELSPFVVIIIAVIVLWLVWRVITGIIRFVIMLAVIAIALYVVWTLANNMGMV